VLSARNTLSQRERAGQGRGEGERKRYSKSSKQVLQSISVDYIDMTAHFMVFFLRWIMIEVDDFKAFDAHEVAEMLCLKYRTVTRYIQAGQIRARKIGKKYFVTEQDVKAFILAQETNVEKVKTEENGPYSGAIRED
jgi:excisionase family DNA binding protein